MNYEQAIAAMQNAPVFQTKRDLTRLKQVLGAMGDPQRRLPYIHIAGTNGKGSVAAMLHSILCRAGYRTGLFTSPYIHRFNERIRVNDMQISDDEVASGVTLILDTAQSCGQPLAFFDIVTLLGFWYFSRMQCDIVVLETGLGGRLDATNVIEPPLAAVITSIGLDHTEVLGDTLESITINKCGIIKSGCDVVCPPLPDAAKAVVADACVQKGAALHHVLPAESISQSLSGQTIRWKQYRSLRLSLLGMHQCSNAAVALETVDILRQKGWSISDSVVEAGLHEVRWPGRFELLHSSPAVIVDGAHNPQGTNALVQTLKTCFPDKKGIFIVGTVRDKDYAASMRMLLPAADRFFTVTPPSGSRALPAAELAGVLEGYGANVQAMESIPEAIEAAMQAASKDDFVCVCGSIYQIAPVRAHFGFCSI